MDSSSLGTSFNEVGGSISTPPTSGSEAQDPLKQFIIEDIDGNSTSDLCLVCRTINFQKIFNVQARDIPLDGLPVFTLPNLRQQSSPSSCLCCRMLASMAFPDAEVQDGAILEGSGSVWHLRVFLATSLWGHFAREIEGMFSESITTFISLMLAQASPNSTLKYRVESWKRGIILRSSGNTGTCHEESNEAFSCKAVEFDKYVDGASIRKMLEVCSTRHLCSKQSLKFPLNSSVIDCETTMIVPLTSGMKYFALSYVWGNESINNSPDEISSQKTSGLDFPLVVEDAIILVCRSGYRYLWVDRYCIQQHNNMDKQHQIRQMANIYSNATATICALGAHANIRIPGVSSPRRMQLSFESQGFKLIRCTWPELDLQAHLQRSKWITRGWTFQEPLLSQRCLFFTPETALQVCQETTMGDTLHISSAARVGRASKRSLSLSAKLFDSGLDWYTSRSTDLQNPFVGEVQEYQRREFTYEGDVLDAFRGILSIIGMQSYWGVPVLISDFDEYGFEFIYDEFLRAQGFAFGLLWHVIESKKSSQARQQTIQPKAVPSWSWVSQTKSIVDFISIGSSGSSLSISRLYFPASRTILLAHLETTAGDNTTISIEKLFLENHEEKCVPEATIFLDITSITARWNRIDKDKDEHKGSYDFWPHQRQGTDPVALTHYDGFPAEVEDAHVYLDEEYSRGTFENEANQAASRTESGLAVLLFMLDNDDFTIDVFWLAIRPLNDGTFRREGILISRVLWWEDGLSVNVPEDLDIPRERMTTIRLG